MKQHIFRNLKCHCINPNKLREQIILNGATLKKNVKQEDHIYHIREESTGYYTGRLRIRFENDKPFEAYTYSRNVTDDASVSYTTLRVDDIQVHNIIKNFKKPTVVVRKQREVWSRDDLLIHIDHVETVGYIFEIESFNNNQELIAFTIEKFKPFLGDKIEGSNEDLVKHNH